MEKDTSVTIRINSSLRSSLAAFAKDDGTSLSALIESTLLKYAEERRSRPREEKRRHARRPVTIPALVAVPGTQELYSGMILDISHGGLRIALPKGCKVETQENEAEMHLDVHFPLPGEKLLMKVRCRAQRIEEADETMDIGVEFSDCKFDEYLRFTHYLAR